MLSAANAVIVNIELPTSHITSTGQVIGSDLFNTFAYRDIGLGIIITSDWH